MTDYYRQAIDAAVRDTPKPLADLEGEELRELSRKVFDYLISWGVFMEIEGELLGGPLLREANRAYNVGISE